MSLKVRMLYFGQSRDAAGVGEESYSLPEGSRLKDLFEEAASRHPGLKRMEPSSQLALNEELVRPDAPLKDGDLVAFLPPVAGG